MHLELSWASYSGVLDSESDLSGVVNAGHGVWCSYFEIEENKGWSHFVQTYMPKIWKTKQNIQWIF